MKKNILIIDDYSPLLEEMAEFLEMEGFHVETAKNGAEGVQKALLQPPDMILCDILMPELDGYQVYNVITKIPQLSTVPFIFITAKATPEDYRKGLDLGVDDYLTKPFTLTQLLSTIEKRFEKINKYKSLKEEIINYFFTNPLLSIFIIKNDKLTFINDKFKQFTGYSIMELNKIKPEKIILGNGDVIFHNIKLLLLGIKKQYQTDVTFLSKSRQVKKATVYFSALLIDKDVAVIGSCVEKQITQQALTQTSSYENTFNDFVNFLNESNKKELSKEFSVLYEQMLADQEIKMKIVKNKIKISKREKEVLKLICQGYKNKEIAEKLFISSRTVDNHRANLLRKTNTKNSAELVAFAIKNKLISLN